MVSIANLLKEIFELFRQPIILVKQRWGFIFFGWYCLSDWNWCIRWTICILHNHPALHSPDSCTSSWSSVCPLWHFSSFPFHFPCTPITKQPDRVHFSPLGGWMKIKSKAKWCMGGTAGFDSWWDFSPLLPKPSNGELRSAPGDTVKTSGTADYRAKYWSLPHTCQNSPHPLIRISPSCHTGTNRIY